MNYPENWTTLSKRTEVINKSSLNFSNNHSKENANLEFKELKLEDIEKAEKISKKVTENTPYFADVMGLTMKQMEQYWKALLKIAVKDREAVVLGLYNKNELNSVLIFGTADFPTTFNTIKFLINLLLLIGPFALFRYIKAIFGYEKLLALNSEEKHATCRGIWFYVDPKVQNTGYGSALLSSVISIVRNLGFKRMQCAFDNRDSLLTHFYSKFNAQFKRKEIVSGFSVQEAIADLDKKF